MIKSTCIPIIIPAYDPDSRLISLLKELKKLKMGPIIIVNDGSNLACDKIFKAAVPFADTILRHPLNYGKGKALKTAFQYVLKHYPHCTGVITADSDGQHSPACIQKIMKALKENRGKLILGTRDFSGENIPWKSRFGNRLTRLLLYYITGINTQDSQTGLRGIPLSFLKDCMNLSGDHFEFEMQMLLKTRKKLPIYDVPIKTIYDSVQNHSTHFKPFTDSIRIYKYLGWEFLKYIFSALSSFILDIFLFSFFMHFMFNGLHLSSHIAVATFCARGISLLFNYSLNYKLVFCSNSPLPFSFFEYLILALIQMSLSALCVIGLDILCPNSSVIILKIFVDTLLFLLSYFIQQKYIFNK